MALLHNNKAPEAIELINEALKNDRSCGFSFLMDNEIIDGYLFILKYANSIL